MRKRLVRRFRRRPRSSRRSARSSRVGKVSRFRRFSKRSSRGAKRFTRSRRSSRSTRRPRVAGQNSRVSFGKYPRRPRKLSRKLHAAINSAIYPLRTLAFDTTEKSTQSVPGRITWVVDTVLDQIDVDRIFQDSNYWFGGTNTLLTATNIVGGTASTYDVKVQLDSAVMTHMLTNITTTPLFIQAYWAVPRHDIVSGTQGPGQLIGDSYNGSNAVDGTSTPPTTPPILSYTDDNFTIWEARNFLEQFKIVSRKSVTVMPGCSANFNTSVGRRVLNRRIWDSLLDNSGYYLVRGYSKHLILRVSSAVLGYDYSTSPNHLVMKPAIAVALNVKYKFIYRPLWGDRPSFNVTKTPMIGVAGDVVEVVNPVSGHVEQSQFLV